MISGANRDEPYGSTIRPTYLAQYSARNGITISHFGLNHPELGDTIPGLVHCDLPQNSFRRRFRHIYNDLKNSPPDVIYTHQIESGKLGLTLSYFLRKPHVFDAHSSIALEAPTYAHTPVAIRRRQFLYERLILKFSRKIIVPSAELENFLQDRYHLQSGKFAIVKNGVDRTQFFPHSSDPRLRQYLGFDDDDFLVVFTNPRLPTFPSNEMALRYFFDIIPRIESHVAQAKFLILGGGPVLKPPSGNVIYTGYVEDLPSHINMANVCVAPFPAQAVCGGTRTKVCEYLACGKPVVATSEGMRGFDDAVPGKHFFLANTAEDFVNRVVDCYNSPQTAVRIGQNAHKLSAKYGWNHLSQDLVRSLAEVVSSYNIQDRL